MGKKSSQAPSSQASQADPMSPSLEPPRMDPPPPYDTVRRSSRDSLSSSARSVDRLDPDAIGNARAGPQPVSAEEQSQSQTQPHEQRGPADAHPLHKKRRHDNQDGGCCNWGSDVKGCMNYGAGSDGCMNYYSKGGCMNYKSTDGCMNYKSTGGCMNVKVGSDWEGNEGCMNYKRGGGCMLCGD